MVTDVSLLFRAKFDAPRTRGRVGEHEEGAVETHPFMACFPLLRIGGGFLRRGGHEALEAFRTVMRVGPLRDKWSAQEMALKNDGGALAALAAYDDDDDEEEEGRDASQEGAGSSQVGTGGGAGASG